MPTTVEEIFRQRVITLEDDEKLQLIELIVRDFKHRAKNTEQTRTKSGGIRATFGTWQFQSLTAVQDDLDHNEQIDLDLALAASDDHEDERF